MDDQKTGADGNRNVSVFRDEFEVFADDNAHSNAPHAGEENTGDGRVCEADCIEDLAGTGILDHLREGERRAVAAVAREIHLTQLVKHHARLWSEATYSDFARVMGGAHKSTVSAGVRGALENEIIIRIPHPTDRQRFLYRVASELLSPRFAAIAAGRVSQRRLFAPIDPPVGCASENHASVRTHDLREAGTAREFESDAVQPVGSPDRSGSHANDGSAETDRPAGEQLLPSGEFNGNRL
jgi:hypothetical protein